MYAIYKQTRTLCVLQYDIPVGCLTRLSTPSTPSGDSAHEG